MASTPTNRGECLFWNDQEKLALTKATAVACTYAVIAVQKTIAALSFRLRSAFLKHKPPNAWSSESEGGDLDLWWWNRRTLDAFPKIWKEIIADCIRFRAIQERISGLQLTENPSNDELYRSALM